MGAYLGKPITEKCSNDDEGDRVACGASSMQGWRISQEDAHNCIIDYDVNTSLFAVYDGHGGHEVAFYCSKKLPDFIKSTQAYQDGDMKQALIDAFIKFDATIATPEVVAELKEIAQPKDGEDKKDGLGEGDEGSDDENVDDLYEEAAMPIEKVLEKYNSNNPGFAPSLLRLRGSCSKTPISPCLKAKNNAKTDDGAGSSKSAAKSSNSHSNEENQNEKTEVTEKIEENSSNDSEKEIKDVNNVDNEDKKDKKEEITNSTEEEKITTNGESGQLEIEKPVQNGDVSKEETKENGEVTTPKSKGKGKALNKTPISVEENKSYANLRKRPRVAYDSNSDSEDSEDQDESFQENEEAVDSDDDDEEDDINEDDEEDIDEDSSEEESSDEDETEESFGEDDDDFQNMPEEPGSDSGCTAVVALLHNNDLYVANAGDSRCIVCRNGQVIEMSFDHKPENEQETERIVKAGGKVTLDGRVNGGLNLSRAIGDHAYKQNKGLEAQEQMITALPDVMVTKIDPTQDEFMVLACDGIWNFMTNEEVAEFVGSRLKEGREKISQICEEMFDHCLAPTTMGDGTGCDNMTAIIVQFKTGLVGGAKREASPIEPETASKRVKTDETTTDAPSQETVA